jgi:hypothetical protein
MDGTTLREALTDDLETELSRLGSSKWLYALTDGEMTGTAVRSAAAADAASAADRFETWARDADGSAATLFESLAESAAERRDAATDDADVPAADRRTDQALDALEDTCARLGGALAHSLVLDRTIGQMVGFFVGDADPTTAGTFRDLRSAVDDDDRIVETLDAVCDSEDDWERALSAATTVVEATYEEYVETLESMGIQPKNVC